MPLRLAILISGRGSNMEALAHYTAQPDVPAEIVLVLADAEAAGLETAAQLGLAARSVRRSDHVAAVMAAIDSSRADVVFLAGYMRLLSPQFCACYADRLFNIHPSLLPRHKGLDTHARAIAAGDSIHGCSVHMVTEEMDDGLVLAQREVPVHPDDTPETLAARVLIEEHHLYPSLLGALATGLLTITDGVPEMAIGILPGKIKGVSG
ncbi:MAG: phosphoribosylglycinamide formyltransferase, partial [Alphaproteobacteria bacterium]|nr:phosphoribosylglycinamide formyltransferase [Alphaproteobacteria bacterium]